MYKTDFRILVLISLFIIISSFTDSSEDENPFSRDLFEAEGVLIKHPLNNTSDDLSDNEILELKGDDGLTIWFARFFHKDICITGLCNMAKFWIFWDGAGDYLGFRLNRNEPLTKANHIDFLHQDYARLDEILKDTHSILKDLKYEDLAIEIKDESKKENLFLSVDSYTGATPPELSAYVVEDAVFTCYTLWHTVYGYTRNEIKRILEERTDSDYIEKLLKGNNTQKNFALEIIKKDNNLFAKFEPEVLQMIASNNYHLSKKAISIIPEEYLEPPENQIKFIELMNNSLPEIKFEILYKLQLMDNLSVNSILLLLEKHAEGVINVGGLNQVFRIITKQRDKNSIDLEKIRDAIDKMSKSSNPETSNLTTNFLKSF